MHGRGRVAVGEYGWSAKGGDGTFRGSMKMGKKRRCEGETGGGQAGKLVPGFSDNLACP